MPNHLTPAERAAELYGKIWQLGTWAENLTRVIEHDAETRRLALEEASIIAIEQVKEGDATALGWNKACSHICHELDRLAREGA
jgi:hypothetical protein